MSTIVRTPVYIELDRRRELVFDLNTEALIQGANPNNLSLWMKIGEKRNEKTGKVEDTLDVNLENLRVYLWACLYRDAREHDEPLTLEDVGAMINTRKRCTNAFLAVRQAMNQYYGHEPGEKKARA
jgi:hypothetical protein